MIVQQGAINTTALIVPDLYVQIVPPQNLILNGVPTNRAGIVGTATWGPVNTATIVGTMADYFRSFGAVKNRRYDMGTAVAIAVQQGAQDFRCVRVTDGTDVAAVSVVQTSCLTLTALYTGTLGNSITLTMTSGSQASSFRAVVSCPGFQSEVYDNITGSGNALWLAVAAAITNGNSVFRGPSQLIGAVAGAGTAVPTLNSPVTLGVGTPGTDGATSVTSTHLIGVDTASRTGMYVLRGQGCSLAMLADAADSTQWTTQAGFGLAEGIYMVDCFPAGTAIASAVASKASAGADSYGLKLLHGDWIYWNDQTNSVVRLVSPQAFSVGRLANLSPEQSSLNKPLYSVVGSQRSGFPGSSQFQKYSSAELAALFQVNIDLIANPIPAGDQWGVRLGHNSSTDPSRSGDNYTRMTNFIASSLNAGMGLYVGRVINVNLFRQVRSTLLTFLANMLQQGLLGSTDGTLPYAVVCDISNNPLSRTALGYLQADVSVRYQAINEKFIVNLEGGQTVTIARQTLPDGRI